MREYRFRAWDGEKMHYDVVPWQWDFVISLSWHRCERSTGKGFLGSGGKDADFLVPGIAFKELMQFTGLRDKNGREIYEGDVCRNSYFVIYPENGFSTPLFWESRRAGFCLWSSIDNKDPESFCILNDRVAERLEVIGNIYETPELVK